MYTHMELSQELLLFLVDAIKDAEQDGAMSLQELESKLTEADVRQETFTMLVQQLSALTESPDACIELFATVEALPDGPVEPSSLVGLFIREEVVAFNTSRFSVVSRLYNMIKRYVKEFDEAAVARSPLEDVLPNTPTPVAAYSIPNNVRQEAHDKYLQGIKEGEYVGAMDGLHAFFDYTINEQQRDSEGDEGAQERMFAAAILSLAGLHAHFGHEREAMQAILETVRIAQESSDTDSLARALSWLHVVVGASGDTPMEERLLQRCILRAKELKLPHLQVASELSLAKHTLLHARRVAGRVDSDSGTRMATLPLDVSAHISLAEKAAATSRLPGMLGTMHLVQASAWEMYGHRALAKLHAGLVVAYAHPDDSEDNVCLAYAKLATHHAAIGDVPRAVDFLLEGKEHFDDRSKNSTWMQIAAQIVNECALQRQDLWLAERAAVHLHALVAEDTASSCHSPAYGDAQFRLAQILVAHGQYDEAVAALRDLLDKAAADGLQLYAVAYRLELGKIHLAAGSPLSAVPYVLSCLSLCETYSLSALHGQATVVLADIRLAMGHPAHAELLVARILPVIVENCSLVVLADTLLLLGRCGAAVATSLPSAEDDSEALERSAVALCNAYEHFVTLRAHHKAKEAAYLLAHVYHKLGQTEKRNEAARRVRAAEDSAHALKRGRTSRVLLSSEELLLHLADG